MLLSALPAMIAITLWPVRLPQSITCGSARVAWKVSYKAHVIWKVSHKRARHFQHLPISEVSLSLAAADSGWRFMFEQTNETQACGVEKGSFAVSGIKCWYDTAAFAALGRTG